MAANGVGLLTKIGQIINLAIRRGFNPLQSPQPVYWTDMNELINTVELLTKDVHNINNNLPPFWTASSTGTPYNWFTEVYPASNIGGTLTTLYQDVLESLSVTSSGSSIDYHYRVDHPVADDTATIFVKLQQDVALNVGVVGMKVGDAMTGSSSGATGTVISVSNTNISIKLISGTFTTSDTVTGSLSGVVANVLNVYPLQVWELGSYMPSLSKSYFIDGRVFITNASNGSAESEFFVTFQGQTSYVAQILSITGMNASLPIKLMLQGQVGISNHLTARYGRGIFYQLIPELPL